jgi:hypothetical protein
VSGMRSGHRNVRRESSRSVSTKVLPQCVYFSSSHNVHSLPPRIEPLVLLWTSKNPTGGFPETHCTQYLIYYKN